jgi:maltokinase
MSEPLQISPDEVRQCLDAESLREWIARQRWYASKSRSVSGIEVVEGIILREDPLLYLALVQTRFATGTHELYQLPLALTPAGQPTELGEPIARTDVWAAYDALADAGRLVELVLRMDDEEEIEAAEGTFSFHLAGTALGLELGARARAMGVEQSNSSVVMDDRLALKVFRKLEPGINPELEMLRFLTAHGFRNIAPLHGWYDYKYGKCSSNGY